ncbi:MAG: dephospho-CoA kinase [Bacteroidales bacterium]|nr:dephospho-CoA kinase [Bacteroidales bacterium]
MIRVGLTGNIGTGKSTVAGVFEILGVPVYRADQEAKKFLELPETIEMIREAFGCDIIAREEVDRKKLAHLVFNNRAALEKLNRIIHPQVKADLLKWIDQQKGNQYIVQEAAILFESGFYREFDKTILVVAPEELTIKRVMLRDGLSRNEVTARKENQWPQDKKIPMADYLIYNDEQQLIIPQVLKIHKDFTENKKGR